MPGRPALTLSLALTLAVAWVLLLAGPARAHAQLVSSTPGAGEVLPQPPTEIRLVFSEPIDEGYSTLDVLDPQGETLALRIGGPDPADPYALVAPFSGTDDGVYTINWRALSEADGHVTSGFLVFGVGDAEVTGAAGGAGYQAGDLHAGHDRLTAVADVVSRALAYAGFMLATGLIVVGWLVVRPAFGGAPRWLPRVQLAALAAGAAGSALPVWVAASGLDVEASGEGFAQLLGSRVGVLLVIRAVVAAGGFVLAFALVATRPGGSMAVAGIAALTSLSLIAASGHAAGYGSEAPVAADIVHLLSGSVWVSGLVTIAAVAGSRQHRDRLGEIVPRFSALALASIGLLVASGAYASWLATRDIAAIASPYGVTLAIKVALVIAALGLGALNYFDGGRGLPTLGGIGRRVVAETALAAIVIVITANLTTGSPPAGSRAIDIAAAATVTGSTDAISLAIQPGRPGPNRLLVELGAMPHGSLAELELQRLDQDIGSVRLPLRHSDASGGHHDAGQASESPAELVADGVALAANSSWDATVVLLDDPGTERARQRFSFALDEQRIATGAATFPLDPILLVGAGLAGGGVLGVSYWIGGGVLPRTERRASRVALLGGGLIAAILGLAILFAGPAP